MTDEAREIAAAIAQSCQQLARIAKRHDGLEVIAYLLEQLTTEAERTAESAGQQKMSRLTD